MRSQEISAVIKDSLTKEAIPFATIYLSSGKGIITNIEGYFKMQYDASKQLDDSLFISCMDGDPELWADILLDNAKAVIKQIEKIAQASGQLQHAIEAGDRLTLIKLLTLAKERRDALGS